MDPVTAPADARSPTSHMTLSHVGLGGTKSKHHVLAGCPQRAHARLSMLAYDSTHT